MTFVIWRAGQDVCYAVSIVRRWLREDLLNSSGTYVPNSQIHYDPFGYFRTWPAKAVNPDITNHGFTGHRHNNTGVYPTKNVGLIYMNARYYMPEVGRFISADTIVPNPSNPQSFNRYSYVRNSPMNFTDPSGHRECLNSDANGCTDIAPHQPPSPSPSRTPIQPQKWETQLLAMAAFVEMHGHDNKQAEAIIWVLLNRISGQTTITGNAFTPNPYLTESLIAAYVLSNGQTAIANFMLTTYGLLELDGDQVRVIDGRTLKSVVEEAYRRLDDAYSGQLEQLWSEVVVPVIVSFNSGEKDITHGAVYYGHISPEQSGAVTSRLLKTYNALEVSPIYGLQYRVFDDILSRDNPKWLIVNNFIALP